MTRDEFEALPILVEADVVEGTVYTHAVLAAEGRWPAWTIRASTAAAPAAVLMALREHPERDFRLISRGPAAKGRLLRMDDPPGTRFRNPFWSTDALTYLGDALYDDSGHKQAVCFSRDGGALNCHVLDPGEMEADAPRPAPAKVGDVLTPENARVGMRWCFPKTPTCHWLVSSVDEDVVRVRVPPESHEYTLIHTDWAAKPVIIALPDEPTMPSGRMAEVAAVACPDCGPGIIRSCAKHAAPVAWDGIPSKPEPRSRAACPCHGYPAGRCTVWAWEERQRSAVDANAACRGKLDAPAPAGPASDPPRVQPTEDILDARRRIHLRFAGFKVLP